MTETTDPRDAFAWSGLTEDAHRAEELRQQARAAMTAGDWPRATAVLREAIDLVPQASSYEWLGECLLQAGDVRNGILYLAAGIALAHGHFKARTRLAEELAALGPGFRHEALWQVEEALRLDPKYRPAKALLTRVIAADPTLLEHLREGTRRLVDGDD